MDELYYQGSNKNCSNKNCSHNQAFLAGVLIGVFLSLLLMLPLLARWKGFHSIYSWMGSPFSKSTDTDQRKVWNSSLEVVRAVEDIQKATLTFSCKKKEALKMGINLMIQSLDPSKYNQVSCEKESENLKTSLRHYATVDNVVWPTSVLGACDKLIDALVTTICKQDKLQVESVAAFVSDLLDGVCSTV